MSFVRELEAVAGRQASAPAIAWRDCVWSYAELLDAVAQVRAALGQRGLARGARVALLARNCPQYVALYYGALAAGCAVVPLNVQERASVLARQVEHSGAELLIGDDRHPEWRRLAAAAVPLPCRVVPLPLRGFTRTAAGLGRALGVPDGPEPAARSAPGAPEDLAAIIYTSGTTGRPKGVMLSHGNLIANAKAIAASLGMTRDERGLCVLPLQFAFGNSVLNSHMLAGARLTLEDNFAYPHVTLRRVQDEAITGFAGVPSTFALLLARCRLEDFDLSRLRCVAQAGGAMPRPLLDRLRRQLPRTRVFLMYGQTEATARLTCLPPEDIDARPGSVGLPIPGVEIEVRKDGRPVPPGIPGGICARGPNVMLGYWSDAAATAEVLQGGWLETGDVGYLDKDGYVYVVGRSVDMIKVGAFRISPDEVEEVLMGLDGVADAAVIGMPDEILGQAVKAVIVPRRGAELEAMAVRAYCRGRLAAHKVPKRIEFAAVLPRTASGKVRRFELATERAADGG